MEKGKKDEMQGLAKHFASTMRSGKSRSDEIKRSGSQWTPFQLEPDPDRYDCSDGFVVDDLDPDEEEDWDPSDDRPSPPDPEEWESDEDDDDDEEEEEGEIQPG